MAIHKDTAATLWWIVFIVVILIMTVLFLYPRYQTRKQKLTELHHQQEILTKRKTEREKLRKKVDDLANSPAAVEKTAREKFGMARPGETILLLPEQKKSHGR